MPPAASGDTVKVHYTARLDDGSVVDTSDGGDPIEITLGGGQVIPGFEEALVGMAPGERKRVRVPCAKAYGERSADMICELPRAKLPPGAVPVPGQRVRVNVEGGHSLLAVVVAVTEQTVTLDANHRMAGKDLVFDLHLAAICDGPSGHDHGHGPCGCGHDHG